MGIGLSGVVPNGSWGDTYDAGFQVGLQIHFNRESRHLGRLRIDYLQADSKHPIQTGLQVIWNGTTYVDTPILSEGRMEAYAIAYEWMPHLQDHSRSGLFGIFGMGGTLWNETFKQSGYYPGSRTESDWGFTLSAGLGWRFNPHATLEARYVNSDLAFHGHHNYGSSRSYLTVGTSLRF